MTFWIAVFMIYWWCLASSVDAGQLLLHEVTINMKSIMLSDHARDTYIQYYTQVCIHILTFYWIIVYIAPMECYPLTSIRRNPVMATTTKQFGSPFKFRCKSTCNGNYRFFHYNHTTAEFDQIFQSPSDTYKIPALSFNDGGDYCCSQHCGSKITEIPNFQMCCLHVKSKRLASYIHG